MKRILNPITAEIDEETLDLIHPRGSYSIYVSNPEELGRVIDILSHDSDGSARIEFSSDDDGNTVYTVCGTVDDIFYIETVERRCNELGIKALFSY